LAGRVQDNEAGSNKESEMAKCPRCGKHGLFFKVEQNGLCKDCNRIEKLEADERKLKEGIETLKAKYTAIGQAYQEIKGKKDELYNSIANKAKKDALETIADQINRKNTELQAVTEKVDDNQKHLNELLEEEATSEKKITSAANKLLKIQTVLKSLRHSAKRYSDEEIPSGEILKEEVLEESDNLLSTTVKLKLNLLDIRELRKRYNQNNKIIKELLAKYQGRYTTKANMSIYRLMVIALEAELQNILYNLKYSKLDKAIKDVKVMTTKYQKIVNDGNQSIAPTVTKFIGEIEYLFIEAIKIEYEYYIQKERIKEEQRAIREQMRQEAKERKHLEEERKKIEQEEEKYKNEISSVQGQLSNTKDKLLIQQLEERIAKIQAQLNDVEAKKDDIIKLEHGQAGYVYVISNLGSFGENVFKIGMTRRMEPQERIDELGDASVPFRFDVHAMMFSDNANELESRLHKQLHDNRVNKINLRKEFFKTSIDELEELVYSLEPSAIFNKTMLAEQYYQSMAVKEIPDSVNIIDDDDADMDIDEDEDDIT
jgi:septal ring factor EnvC (AmiA/AmiB activator)